MPWWGVIPGWREQVGHICQETRATGKPFKAEAYSFVFPEQPERGTTYWNSSVSPVYGPDNTFLGWLLLLREVTGRVRAAEDRERLAWQLREVNQQLAIRSIEVEQQTDVLSKERDFSAAVLETVGCLVTVLDRQGRILQFNRACEELQREKRSA